MKIVAGVLFLGVWGHFAWAQCSADEEDLCSDDDVNASGRLAPSMAPLAFALALALPRGGAKHLGWALAICSLAYMLPRASAAPSVSTTTSASAQATCGTLKAIYKANKCCGHPNKVANVSVMPMPPTTVVEGDNPCKGKKPIHSGLDPSNPQDDYFKNDPCGAAGVLEQAGTDVTAGYSGDFNTTGRDPISTAYWQAGLCPVNVHWHLGAEHRSNGEYDESGKFPHFALNATYSDPLLTAAGSDGGDRRLGHSRKRGGHWHPGMDLLSVDDKNAAGSDGGDRRLGGTRVRKGFSCHKYDSNDPRFTTKYPWKHCVDMHVGETYEVHWPHSAAGACGTPWQYQTPFYDGVFCMPGIISLNPLNTFQKIGVQAQIFTIVNDEKYFYPDLIRGMIVNGDYGNDMAYYTGSTTGTSRDNTICSKYTPITWQVDRKCHLISASSFDKLCADMKLQSDDMSADLRPNGARELVADKYAANDGQR